MIRRAGYSSLAPAEWDVTFETAIPCDHVNRLSKWRPEMKRGVLLHGKPGRGKSRLGLCIINRFASETYRCKFITFADILSKQKDSFDNDQTTPEIELAKLRNVNLLFIDDFGAEKLTEWGETVFFQIFDHRVAQSMPTFLSSNYSLDELSPKVHPRIIDRILKHCSIVECKGPSFRIGQHRNDI